jgi:hypothetical protein
MTSVTCRTNAATGEPPPRVLSRATAIVEAPPDQVADVLYRMSGEPAPHDRHFRIDRARRRIVVQGNWWYRGVYSLEPHHEGTLVIYEVHNVARRARWLVPLVLLQYRLSGQLTCLFDVSGLAARVGARLGCRARAPAP